ncbi:MAG: hypothetical protein U0931_34535 [Vulcanimicrobiota bacterium]
MTGTSEELKQAWIKAWVAYGFGDYDVAGKRFQFWLQRFNSEREGLSPYWSARMQSNCEQLLAEISRHLKPQRGRSTPLAEQQRLNSAFWAGRHLMVMLSRQERTMEGPMPVVRPSPSGERLTSSPAAPAPSRPAPTRQAQPPAPSRPAAPARPAPPAPARPAKPAAPARAAAPPPAAPVPPAPITPPPPPPPTPEVATPPTPAAPPPVEVSSTAAVAASATAGDDLNLEMGDELGDLSLDDLDLSDLDTGDLDIGDLDLDEASLEEMDLGDLDMEGLEGLDDLDLDENLEDLDLGE